MALLPPLLLLGLVGGVAATGWGRGAGRDRTGPRLALRGLPTALDLVGAGKNR